MLAYECAYKIVCPNPKPHDKKRLQMDRSLSSLVLNMQEEEVKD